MLTPKQIGLLAEKVQNAIRDNPVLILPYPVSMVLKEGEAPEEFMEDWEKQLKEGIDNETELPSYDELQRENSELLEELIGYFSEDLD